MIVDETYNEAMLKGDDAVYYAGYQKACADALNKEFIIGELMELAGDESILGKLRREIAEEVFHHLEWYLSHNARSLLLTLVNNGCHIRTLGDLVWNAKTIIDIEVRLQATFDGDVENEEDMFFGACRWDPEKKELISLDGDSYGLSDVVCKWEWHEDGTLTVWEKGEFLSGSKFDEHLAQFKASHAKLLEQRKE